MKHAQLARRYARALLALAQENGTSDRVIVELRVLKEALNSDVHLHEFFDSPVVPPSHKEEALKKALSSMKLLNEVVDFVLLLAKRDRLAIFGEIVDAFEGQSDAVHGVTRGTVESAIALGPDARKQLESIVKKVTQKEVILNYKINPSIIGGLIARVGSYTFDDSIRSHLRRMNEDLKRRTI